DVDDGLLGDSWRTRGRSGGRPANTKAQITVMNVRSTALLAGGRRGVGRPRGRSGGRPANTKAQITVMNVRSTALVAGDRERWPLAGDQLYVDFDLSREHISPVTPLAVRQ